MKTRWDNRERRQRAAGTGREAAVFGRSAAIAFGRSVAIAFERGAAVAFGRGAAVAFAVALTLILGATLTACGQEEGCVTDQPDVEYIQNGYGTIFVTGRRIEHVADTSTSTVVDWQKEPAAKADKSLKVNAEDIIYRTTTMTDGKDKGGPLELRMILKRNEAARSAQPVIIFVPGGGFISCQIDDKYEGVHKYLIQHGYAVAIIQYHVIGQGRYCDAVDDVRGAVDWVKENADEYGLDASRIVLMGNSGGGYVAALTACEKPEDIRCVVNFYGLCDIVNNKADYEEAAIEAQHTPESSDSQYVNGVYSGLSLTDAPEEAKKSDPMTYVDGDEPPFIHFHGTEDLLVSPSQTLHLHTALQEAGEETTRYVLEGEGHGTKGFRTAKALDLAIKFMDRHVK